MSKKFLLVAAVLLQCLSPIAHGQGFGSATSGSTRLSTFQLASDELVTAVSAEDPDVVQFMTQSFGTEYSAFQIHRIRMFLSDRVKIESNFKILLINRNNYGLRIVIKVQNSGQMFEGVIESSVLDMELLFWRQIGSYMDIDVDIFTRYFPIEADQEVMSVLKKVFANNPKFTNFKEIRHIEKRLGFDGIYFKIVLLSSSNNAYQINFLRRPKSDFNEVMQYQLIDISLDMRKSKTLKQIPSSDPMFISSFGFIMDNYAGVLKGSKIVYLSTLNEESMLYRYQFQGPLGKYEIITSSPSGSQDVKIVRWQKLEDGYIQVDLQKLKTFKDFKVLENTANDFVLNKFKNATEIENVQIRTSPSGNSYRLFFKNTQPFILTLEYNSAAGALSVVGVERIQILPKSKYYNDLFFRGFHQISEGSARHDEIFLKFDGILKQKEPDYYWVTARILAIFKQSLGTETTYKVLYKLYRGKFVVTFSYDRVDKSIQLVGMKHYKETYSPGYYRWKCLRIERPSLYCTSCFKGAVNTAGRCYSQLEGCSLQYSSTCYSCKAGYVKTDYKCERSPIMIDPEAEQANYLTSTGRENLKASDISLEVCSQSRNGVCEKCPDGYYLDKGICKNLPPACQKFDVEDGICIECMSGYFSDPNMKCKLRDKWCKNMDVYGNCKKCYAGYEIMEDGFCKATYK